MADNVTNEAVLVALKGLGFNISGPISMTGAQNSEWKRKILPLLGAQYGQGAEDMFNRAIQTAKKIKDIPVDAEPTARLALTLRAYGTNETQMLAITNEAKRLVKTTPGIRPAGQDFSASEYAQAVSNVLGHTGAALDALSNAGFKQPPPPQPGSAGAKLTPPPAAPAAPGAPAPAPGQPAPAPAPTPKAKPKGKVPGTPTPVVAGPTLDASGRVVDKGLPANAGPAEIEAYFRRNYGAEAWMINIPDFKDIVKQVATNPGGWSLSSVTSAIQVTPWWQANGQNVADYLKDKANMSPADFQQKLGTHTATIKSEMAKYGITLTDERLLQLGTEAYKWNWDPTQIAKSVADEFDYHEGQHSTFIDKLQNEAKQYLTPLSAGTINSWGDRLIMDPNEQGNWTEFLKNQAKSMFPSFADRLDTETMADIADPYAKIAAQTLEMDSNDVNFQDPKWLAALDQVDAKGVHTSMSYADWNRKLKTDETYRYDYTEGAKQNAMGMATGLLRRFGAIA